GPWDTSLDPAVGCSPASRPPRDGFLGGLHHAAAGREILPRHPRGVSPFSAIHARLPSDVSRTALKLRMSNRKLWEQRETASPARLLAKRDCHHDARPMLAKVYNSFTAISQFPSEGIAGPMKALFIEPLCARASAEAARRL